MRSRARSPRVALLALAVAAASLGAARPADAQETPFAIAIVTHPSTPIDDLSFGELRKIFLGEQQFWQGSRIVLLVRAPVARERDIVLRRIYRMDESAFKQYWIAKVFRAEVSSKPRIVYSTDMTRELVTALPGAVAFLPASAVTPGMKVVRINGKLPGDSGYPLQ